MTTTKAEELAAETLDTWTANYSLHLDPHALHAFWSSGAPAACALALKAAVAELRRLAAVGAELAGAKKALALVQQHHATAWNRGHEAGMRASRDAVKQATDAAARDAWGNTQLTEALLAVEMSTNTKLAEALRLAREWFRHEEAGEGPQAYDVIKAADEAIAAHDAEQAQEPVAWRVWRGDSYELFFNEEAAKRRCECFIRKGKPEPLYAAPVEQASKAVPADPCVVLWQAMNEAEKVGNRTDDKLIVWALRRAGYCIAAISEQEPCHDAWRAALAQRREPLTASQVNELCNECHLDWHRGWSLDEEPNRYLELARAIEKHHGIGTTTGEQR